MSLRSVTAVLVLTFFSLAARADTLALDSVNSSNGSYKYSFYQTNVPNGTEHFATGAQFTLTGLSGVTGASVIGVPAFVASFTSTSATFTLQYGEDFYSGSHHDLFVITSSVLTTADVQYAIPGTPVSTGAVPGPAAATAAVTPEPSGFILLVTGMLAAMSAGHRRSV